MPLKVAIVGTGNVGSTLGRRLVQGGQAIVCFASRDPNSERAKKLVASIPGTCAGEIDETVAWSDAVILATPGTRTLARRNLPAFSGCAHDKALHPSCSETRRYLLTTRFFVVYASRCT